MGFMHEPYSGHFEDIYIKLSVSRPVQKGGLRQFSLLEPITMFDWAYGKFSFITPNVAKNCWNGSSAPLGRQRSLIASLRHDIVYAELAKQWERLKAYSGPYKKSKLHHWNNSRKLADKFFACDMYYYDNQPYYRVIYSYYALRLFGAKFARGGK